MRRAIALAAAVLVAVALATVPAGSASAHDFLVSSSPTAGSIVQAPPSTVSLTFNDLVLDLSGEGSSSIVEVTGPDAATTHFETGCASILGRTVSVPVALGSAGVYLVSWQIVSSDGHPVSDSISFSYAPTAGTVAASGTTTALDCGRSGGSASDGAAGWLILGVAGGVVLLALIAVVVVLLVSRRRKDSEKKI